MNTSFQPSKIATKQPRVVVSLVGLNMENQQPRKESLSQNVTVLLLIFFAAITKLPSIQYFAESATRTIPSPACLVSNWHTFPNQNITECHAERIQFATHFKGSMNGRWRRIIRGESVKFIKDQLPTKRRKRKTHPTLSDKLWNDETNCTWMLPGGTNTIIS